jgi:hypothetical protein
MVTFRLIVLDRDGRPEGLVSHADVVSSIQPVHRRTLLAPKKDKGFAIHRANAHVVQRAAHMN